MELAATWDAPLVADVVAALLVDEPELEAAVDPPEVAEALPLAIAVSAPGEG